MYKRFNFSLQLYTQIQVLESENKKCEYSSLEIKAVKSRNQLKDWNVWHWDFIDKSAKERQKSDLKWMKLFLLKFLSLINGRSQDLDPAFVGGAAF